MSTTQIQDFSHLLLDDPRIVAAVGEAGTMADDEPIPPELRAEVECRRFFMALREGEYVWAAKAQEALQKLGWTLTRTKDEKPRRRRPVTQ
jgi:hypothetical protein